MMATASEKGENGNSVDPKTVTLIAFDLETTGLGRDSDILQISAIHGDECFDQYIITDKPILERTSSVNKLTMEGGRLNYKSKPVDATTKVDGMEKFIRYLKGFENPVLAAHNCKSFDSKILVNFLRAQNLLGEFEDICPGFVDTLFLFRAELPGRKSYKQADLVRDLLKEEYEAHNALEDVKALQKLMSRYSPETILKHFFTVQSVIDGM